MLFELADIFDRQKGDVFLCYSLCDVKIGIGGIVAALAHWSCPVPHIADKSAVLCEFFGAGKLCFFRRVGACGLKHHITKAHCGIFACGLVDKVCFEACADSIVLTQHNLAAVACADIVVQRFCVFIGIFVGKLGV